MTNYNDRVYFLLSVLMLFLCGLIIVLGCGGMVFIMMRAFKSNKEQFFQFDEKEGKVRMADVQK